MPCRLYLNPWRSSRPCDSGNKSVAPVERVDGGLLVDAEHGGVAGRVWVETEDGGGRRHEVGVVGGHVTCQPVRQQVGLAPHRLARCSCPRGGGPRGGGKTIASSRLAARGGQNAGAQPHRQFPPRTPLMTVRPARHAVRPGTAGSTW